MSSDKVHYRSQILTGLAIVAVAVLVAVLLFVFKPRAEKKPAPYQPPPVSWMEISPQTVSIPVQSQGTVEAKTTINLSVEVAGRISKISEQLNDGEYFKQGDVLARIDDSDYRLAITKAEAQVAAARQALARVEAEAEQARFDIQRMGQDIDKASPYALRIPHLKEARANLKAADADLAIARLQQQRTSIRAPFDGRVIEKLVDVGEYVSPGKPLASIFSTHNLQVKLPLSVQQQKLLALPTSQEKNGFPKVSLSANYTGGNQEWSARITRVESTIDIRNRLLYAIAEINGELNGIEQNALPTAGLFVEASIEGRPIDNVFVLPRIALRGGHQIWRIRDDKLDIVEVGILHKNDEYVYIDNGLQPGDRIIVSALDYAIQDMRIQPET